MAIARILVYGNVQGVGFRAYVEQIARGMQIKGFARNLPDGRVEIYTQTPKQKINAFIKKIDLQGNSSDPFSLDVTKIEVVFEHDKNFIKPDRMLGVFETDYGKESDLQKEMVKKAAIATFLMHSLNSKSDSLISKTDSFRTETSNNFKRLETALGGKTDSLRKETSHNFKNLEKTLGSKTDSFRTETSKNFKKLANTLGGKTDSFRKETSHNFSKLDGKYGSVFSTLSSIDGRMKNINTNIKQNNKLLSKIANRF